MHIFFMERLQFVEYQNHIDGGFDNLTPIRPKYNEKICLCYTDAYINADILTIILSSGYFFH